jgi:imidazolonepropionase-like amidohydrolase
LADLSRAALINEIPSPDIYYAALVAGPSFFNDPRTVSSALGMQPGQVPWLYAVTEETQMPLAIAQARGTGATGLKIYANLPGDLVKKLVSEAHKQDFPVWTHMQVYPATPYDSLGATSVSHVCMIARYLRENGKASYGHANEPSYAGLTAADPGIQQYITALARSGSILDATLSVYLPAPGAPAVPGKCSAQLAGDITRAAHLAGVPIDAGTDTDSVADDPYPALYGELRALVHYAGFNSYDALVSATRVAAQAVGKSNEIGTLEPGKFADIAFFSADPAQDVRNLSSITWTIKRGHRFARSDYHHKPIPLPPDE